MLAAFYVRLTFDAVDVYKTLEPLLSDFRKVRRRTKDGGYALTFVDQFVDDLLTKERVCGTSLRKLPVRTVLEDLGQLEERVSPLGEEIEEIDGESERDERSESASGGSEYMRRRNGTGHRYDRSESGSESESD